jgi:hypothetical protein
MRSINRMMGKPLPIYADPFTMSELRARFRYIFAPVDAEAFLRGYPIAAGTAL